MSEGLWRTRFGADPSLDRRDIRLNGQPFTVIGIVPDDVQLQRPARIWSLVPEAPADLSGWLPPGERVRFKSSGASSPASRSRLRGPTSPLFGERLARDYPETHKDWSINVEPLRAAVMGPELQLTSLFLFGVVGFVLLLCCANVANLLLARGSVRSRELAVRSALGAGRSRIVAQLLTESLVLATLGGLLGIAFGDGDSEAGARDDPGRAPASRRDARLRRPCPRRSAPAASLVAGVLFGVVPAWQGTRTSLVQAIAFRQQIGHAKRRSVPEPGGRRRSRGGGAAAVRRRVAAAHAARPRRLRPWVSCGRR